MKKKLIKQLENSVKLAEKSGENMNDVSWGMQEGILISYNEAKLILSALSQPPIDNKAVDDEALIAMAEKEYPNASVGPLCGPLQREAYIKGVKGMINAITNHSKK